MQKIEASKLLNKIFNESIITSMVILSDDDVFQKCAEEALTQYRKKRPQIYQGTNAVADYNSDIRQNNLFEPPSDALIILDKNFSNKKKERVFSQENIVFVFGNTSLRHTITEEFFPKAEISICYAQNDLERQKCTEILAEHYRQFSTDSFNQKYPHNNDIPCLAEIASLHYNGNLYQCALHFERMAKSGLSFEDAKLNDTEISGFDIISTLLENNLQLLEFRLRQHADNGEDATSIFGALVYFFKQLAHVYAELEHTSNIDMALRHAKIPYPAQNNIKNALSKIPYEKVEHFFSICAKLELSLRESKNAHQVLFFELRNILN